MSIKSKDKVFGGFFYAVTMRGYMLKSSNSLSFKSIKDFVLTAVKEIITTSNPTGAVQ